MLGDIGADNDVENLADGLCLALIDDLNLGDELAGVFGESQEEVFLECGRVLAFTSVPKKLLVAVAVGEDVVLATCRCLLKL